MPLIITGPGIAAGVQTDVMANGLDFYPTILALAGIEKPEGKHLDGCDLAPLLLGDPTDPTLVKEADGSVRDTMVWHFPHGVALESTIRVGDWKLVRNYDHAAIRGHRAGAVSSLQDGRVRSSGRYRRIQEPGGRDAGKNPGDGRAPDGDPDRDGRELPELQPEHQIRFARQGTGPHPH